MQLPLGIFEPSSTWSPPDINSLPSWAGVKRIGFDTETKDPDLKKLGPGPRRPDSHMAGFSFAIEDGPSFYLPLRHEGGDNMPDVEQALRYLRDQAAAFDGVLVGMNMGYDLDFAAEDGITFPKVKWYRDVSIADPLINELHSSYSLQNIAERWGCAGKNEALLREAARAYRVDPKGGIAQLPARYVGPYATDDAVQPLEILRKQEREIEAQDLEGVYNLESRLVPLLVKLRRKGVRIDQDRLAKIVEWSLEKEAAAWALIRAKTGVRIQVGDAWKAERLAPALRAIGVDVPLTGDKKPKPSIDKFLLARIDHEVARAMEEARKVNKLRTTFAASIYAHMTNGRIHCSFNQLRATKDEGEDGEDDLKGAAYGRLSSEHPNMQQQPARDEFAKMWRSIYIPEEGKLWAALDYSQQEPRMVVHYACLSRALIKEHAWERAERAAHAYRTDPSTDNHQMMADMAGIQRKAAKEIFLGLCYGMGGAKLCKKLGLPTQLVVYGPRGMVYPADSREGQALRKQGKMAFEGAGPEGQALLSKFDQEVPFVKRLARACQAKAQEQGFIRTLSGRRCRFPKDDFGNWDWTHKALNRLIQGSSADQTKTAMLALDDAGHELQLQVHDEIDGSVESREEANAMAEIMVTCVDLKVPSKVDVEIGKSWGDSMT